MPRAVNYDIMKFFILPALLYSMQHIVGSPMSAALNQQICAKYRSVCPHFQNASSPAALVRIFCAVFSYVQC